jgi:hypothetical protein
MDRSRRSVTCFYPQVRFPIIRAVKNVIYRRESWSWDSREGRMLGGGLRRLWTKARPRIMQHHQGPRLAPVPAPSMRLALDVFGFRTRQWHENLLEVLFHHPPSWRPTFYLNHRPLRRVLSQSSKLCSITEFPPLIRRNSAPFHLPFER